MVMPKLEERLLLQVIEDLGYEVPEAVAPMVDVAQQARAQELAMLRHKFSEAVLGLFLQHDSDPDGGGGLVAVLRDVAQSDACRGAMAFSAISVVANSLRLRRFTA